MSSSLRPCPAAPSRRRARGISVVELMVGLVVSLLVGLAATGSAITFLALQRQGVASVGSAVGSGTVMSSMRDEVSTAGLGFFGDGVYLCNRLNLSTGAAVLSDGATFSPVQVTRQATHDQLDLVFGSRVEAGATVRLAGASTGASALLASLLPVTVGEAVLLTPPPSSTPGAVPCLIRTVTANTASTMTTRQRLDFAAAGQHNAAIFTNQPGFGSDGRVTSLGALRWSRYRLVGTDLVLERPLDGQSAVVARDVVAFRTQYGISAAAAGSTTIEQWVEPTGGFAALSAAVLPRVRAVRVGLIVRVPQRQKVNESGVCDATDTQPVLFGRAPEGLATDWACYRYRTAVINVPLRNVAMGLRS